MTRECNFEVLQSDFYDWNIKPKVFCNLGKLKKQPCVKSLCPIWKIYQSLESSTKRDENG